MVNIDISPEDITQWFHALSSRERYGIMIAAGLILGLVIGWLIARLWDRDRIKHWSDRVNDYKDRLKGASPTEAASRIAELEAQIQSLKSQQQRIVTGEQWQAISKYLRTLPYDERQRFKFNLKLPYQDLEAERYARDFERIFYSGMSNDAKIGPELTGLIIRIKDKDVIPSAARQLAGALTAAGIAYRYASLELQYPIDSAYEFELVIGRNG